MAVPFRTTIALAPKRLVGLAVTRTFFQKKILAAVSVQGTETLRVESKLPII
jgi:hypothetical protein